ncbi:MAG: hypothetical protein OHK0044_09180 [Burkholderiaceae bacterium]
MLDTLLIGSLAFLLLIMAVWAVQRARHIRAEAAMREEQALAQMRHGKVPANERQGETVFAGMPSQMLPRAGIEVNEVVDLEALLAGEPLGVATRARARLEEPTNIDVGPDTLPPRPAASPAAPSAPATPARTAGASRSAWFIAIWAKVATTPINARKAVSRQPISAQPQGRVKSPASPTASVW